MEQGRAQGPSQSKGSTLHVLTEDNIQECVLHPTFFLSNLKECTRELEKASKRQRMQLNFVLLIFLLVCWKLRFIHWLAVYLLDL